MSEVEYVIETFENFAHSSVNSAVKRKYCFDRSSTSSGQAAVKEDFRRAQEGYPVALSISRKSRLLQEK